MEQIREKYFVSEKAYELLNILKKSGNWQLPAELSTKLKLRREALFELIDELDNVGYGLDFHPYFGLRLIDLPNAYVPGEITNNLNVSFINKDLKIMKDSGSSIKSASELIAAGEAEEGTILLADDKPEAQTWVDHDWFATGKQGICMTLVVKLPSLEVDKQLYLNLIGTLTAAYTLTDNLHIPAKIVLPNSIYVYSKKIGSVLVKQDENSPEFYVIGININVNMELEDLPEGFADKATSMRIELGNPINRNEMLRYLLFNLDNLVNKLRKRKYRPLETLWHDYCALKPRDGKEKKVALKTSDEEFEGSVISSDPISGLIIKTDTEEKIIPISKLMNITII